MRDVWRKAEADEIFFMGGAISFNVLAAFVPLVLFTAGLSGFLVSARVADPGAEVVDFVARWLPAIEGDVELNAFVRERVTGLLDRRGGFTAAGGVFLLWFSTRLVGTVRTVLRRVFEIPQGRGIVWGKFFDMGVVLVGGILFGVNLGVTAVIEAVQTFGAGVLGLDGEVLGFTRELSARILALVSIWVLFVGVYRYLPARRSAWPTALVAATFTAGLHELLKAGFGWYVTGVANYGSTYGNLITVAVLLFWIYYEALGFILGAEVAHVWARRRAPTLAPVPSD